MSLGLGLLLVILAVAIAAGTIVLRASPRSATTSGRPIDPFDNAEINQSGSSTLSGERLESEVSPPLPSRQLSGAIRGVAMCSQADREAALSVHLLPTTKLGFARASGQQIDNPRLVSALSPLVQTLPAAGLAYETGTRQLMEVVINGELVRAADGNGLRAWAIGSSGISDHARLYEVQSLAPLASGLLIWQVASVLVAQKHLADIRKVMERLESKVEGIQRHLENARLGRVRASMEYISNELETIRSGSLSSTGRGEIEAIERDLSGIASEYFDEIEALLNTPEDGHRPGSKKHHAAIKSKSKKFGRTAAELAFALEARLAGCYAASLYPEPSGAVRRRVKSVRESVTRLASLKDRFAVGVSAEAERIDVRVERTRKQVTFVKPPWWLPVPLLGADTIARNIAEKQCTKWLAVSMELEADKDRIGVELNESDQWLRQSVDKVDTALGDHHTRQRLWVEVREGRIERIHAAPVSLLS